MIKCNRCGCSKDLDDIYMLTIHDWRSSTKHYDLILCESCYRLWDKLFDEYLKEYEDE